MKEASFWNDFVPRTMNTYCIVIFVLLWVGFAIALLVNQEWLDLLWNSVRGLPLVWEIIVWIVLLPAMVLLWIWQSSWPALLRALGFAGIAGWTLLAASSFFRYCVKGSAKA